MTQRLSLTSAQVLRLGQVRCVVEHTRGTVGNDVRIRATIFRERDQTKSRLKERDCEGIVNYGRFEVG